MPAQKVKEFLDRNGVAYLVLEHAPAYTAQEVAAEAHVSGKTLVKAVVVKVDGAFVMTVLPADEMIDTEMLAEALGAESVELADEDEFSEKFPGCESGAVVPFGNLYEMEVYVSEMVARNRDLVFCAGTHRELINISYQDYERLVKPKILSFAVPRETFIEPEFRV